MIHINDETIQVKQGDFEAEIYKKGATLNRVSFSGYELFWSYEGKKDINVSPAKSGWLFPFPNRVKKGTYHHLGEEYSFPINDSSGNDNAIHGFILDKDFEVSESLDKKEFTKISFYYDYEGKLPYYPFPFRFFITYLFSDSLKIKVEINNTGEKELPFGIGWHPYFLTDDLSKTKITIPKAEKIKVGKDLIPSGDRMGFEQFRDGAIIGNIMFDDCLYLGTGRKVIILDREKIRIEMKMGDEWRFFQLFTPSEKNSIALEPMTCNINAFNNHDGLRFLLPGEVFSTYLELKMSL